MLGIRRCSRELGKKPFFASLSNPEAKGLTSLPGLIVYGQQDDGSDRAGLTIRETAGIAAASGRSQLFLLDVDWQHIFSLVFSAG